MSFSRHTLSNSSRILAQVTYILAFLAPLVLPAAANAQQAGTYGIEADPDEANKNYFNNQLSELTNTDNDDEVLTTDTHLHDAQGEKDGTVGGSATQAASALFGTGGAEDEAAKEQARNQARWQNFDEGGNKHYRDSAEMKMRAEINAPLPERKPFGDSLGEIEKKFAPKKSPY